jgi:hypothetical protein
MWTVALYSGVARTHEGASPVTETLFKVLKFDGSPHHGGEGRWNLPSGDEPGEWMPSISPLVPCESGYHVCRLEQLIVWLGPAIWTVEIRGDRIEQADKMVAAQARLLACTAWDVGRARSFAFDCAEHGLAIFERQMPGDSRPRRALEAGHRFLAGALDAGKTDEAARAAGAAARAAAHGPGWAPAAGAAWAAAHAARAAIAATDSATAREAADAARAAAAAAAFFATGPGTNSPVSGEPQNAERAWQNERLSFYLYDFELKAA